MLKSPDVQIKVLNMTQGLQQNPNLEKLWRPVDRTF
jgi:hypothetical protein